MPSPRHSPLLRRALPAVACAATLALAGAARAQPGSQPSPQPTPIATPPPAPAATAPSDPLHELADGSQGFEDRLALALGLIERDQRQLVSQGLDVSGDPAARRMLLEAVAATRLPPTWLEPLLLPLVRASSAPAEDASALSRACAAAAARSLAQALLDRARAEPAWSAPVRLALAEMLGLSPSDPQVLSRAQAVLDAHPDETSWQRARAAALVRRVDTLSTRLSRASSELVVAHRTTYELLSDNPQRRPKLLARWIIDDSADVRELAFTLAGRELQAARPLGEEFAQAVVRALALPDPRTRERAAGLLPRLTIADPAIFIEHALRREQDPAVVAALLAAVAQRWREPAIIPAVVDRLSGPARAGALSAGLEILRRSEVSDEHRALLAEAVRLIPPAEWSPDSCKIMMLVGTAEDRARMRERLAELASSGQDGPSPALIELADALADDPLALEQIVSVARAQPALASLAVRATRDHGTARDALDLALQLRFPSEAALVEAIKAVVPLLDDQNLAEAAQIVDGPGAPVVLDGLLRRTASSPEVAVAQIQASARLANIHLQQSQPELALAALGMIEEQWGTSDPFWSALRVSALVGAGRAEEASALGGSPNAWIRGLRLARSAGLDVGSMLGAFEQACGPIAAQPFYVVAQLRAIAGVGPSDQSLLPQGP